MSERPPETRLSVVDARTETGAFDWLLVARYALLCAVAQLFPVPIVDGWIEDGLRRRLARLQLETHGVALVDRDIAMLANSKAGGCLGMVWAVLSWPIKKVFRTLLFILQLNHMANVMSDVVHRALLLREALELGVIPGDAVAVRAAMNRALVGVDTKPVSNALRAVFRASKRRAWGLWRMVRGRVKDELRAERQGDPATGGALSLESERLTAALAEAVRVPGVQAEIIRRFREALAREAAPSVSAPSEPAASEPAGTP